MPAVELQNNSTLARLGDVRVGGIYQGPNLVWGELPDIVDLRLDIAPTGEPAFHFKWFADGSRSPGIGPWDWKTERNTGGGWSNVNSAIAPTWDAGSQEFWGPIVSASSLPSPGVTWRYRLTLITLYGNVTAECDYTGVVFRVEVPPPEDVTLRVSGGSMTMGYWKTAVDINSCEAQIGTDGTSWVASATQPYRISETEWACEPISLYGADHYYRVRCYSADRNDWSDWVVYKPQGAE